MIEVVRIWLGYPSHVLARTGNVFIYFWVHEDVKEHYLRAYYDADKDDGTAILEYASSNLVSAQEVFTFLGRMYPSAQIPLEVFNMRDGDVPSQAREFLKRARWEEMLDWICGGNPLRESIPNEYMRFVADSGGERLYDSVPDSLRWLSPLGLLTNRSDMSLTSWEMTLLGMRYEHKRTKYEIEFNRIYDLLRVVFYGDGVFLFLSYEKFRSIKEGKTPSKTGNV